MVRTSSFRLHVTPDALDQSEALRRVQGSRSQRIERERIPVGLLCRLHVKGLELLLRLLFPPSGRHRVADRAVVAARPDGSSTDLASSCHTPLRGEESRLVRPYLTAHETQKSVRLQRQRRRALWLAVHGIDVGPRLIHGVEVA
jgi:hypothetical protein